MESSPLLVVHPQLHAPGRIHHRESDFDFVFGALEQIELSARYRFSFIRGIEILGAAGRSPELEGSVLTDPERASRGCR